MANLDLKHVLAVVGGGIAGNIVAWSQAYLGGQHAVFTFGTIVANALVPSILALVFLYTGVPVSAIAPAVAAALAPKDSTPPVPPAK